jgi:uncharacterized DUF497 family protein
MNHLAFEWDDGKNTLNKRKHRISFEEALTVFADDHALLLPDPEHSTDEDRFILMAFLLPCGCLWFVTVTVVAKMSYESFRHAKRPGSNAPTTPRGGKNEKRVRFFKGYEEPLCEVFQKTSNDSFG